MPHTNVVEHGEIKHSVLVNANTLGSLPVVGSLTLPFSMLFASIMIVLDFSCQTILHISSAVQSRGPVHREYQT